MKQERLRKLKAEAVRKRKREADAEAEEAETASKKAKQDALAVKQERLRKLKAEAARKRKREADAEAEDVETASKKAKKDAPRKHTRAELLARQQERARTNMGEDEVDGMAAPPPTDSEDEPMQVDEGAEAEEKAAAPVEKVVVELSPLPVLPEVDVSAFEAEMEEFEALLV